MRCSTVVQFVAVGVSVAITILFVFLTQFNGIVGGANLMAMYDASSSTLLAPSSVLGSMLWARSVITVIFSITMFTSPHRDTGKIPARIGIFSAFANLLCAAWILFASYAGGASPELSWAAFLALTLLWTVKVVIVERADLGMRWRQGPLVMLYRGATGRDLFVQDGTGTVENGRAGGARRGAYKRVNRNDNDDTEGGCGDVIDFSSQNATDLRASYSNGARVVHFLFIELPASTMFGAVSVLMFATLAQMIDHYAPPSGDVTLATSVLLQILALIIALVYSVGKGLHGYALGSVAVMSYQYAKQLEGGASIAPLSNTSIASIIILSIVIVVVSVARIYHFIRKTHV